MLRYGNPWQSRVAAGRLQRVSVASSYRVQAGMGLLVIASLLSCVFTAHADPPTDERVRRAQLHVDRGDALFSEKKYASAVDEYTAALALAPHPDLLWNIGRAYEQQARYAQAVYFFEEYASLDISEADRQQAQAKIQVLRPKAAANKKGTLVIRGPSSECTATLGGIKVGAGKAVVAGVKVGRYRLVWSCPKYKPHDVIVRVAAGKQTLIEPSLKLLIPPCRVTAKAQDGIDSLVKVAGTEGPGGAEVTVEPGTHRIEVMSPRRQGQTVELKCQGGEPHILTVDLGPVRHPERFADWSGVYQATSRTVDARGGVLDGAILTLNAAGEGVAILSATEPLKSWRVSHCGGKGTLSYTREWKVRLKDNALELSDGKLTTCSCEAYCQVETAATVPIVPLPGYEGFVAKDFFVLRKSLPGAGVSRQPVDSVTLQDVWTVLTWPSDEESLTLRIGKDWDATLSVNRSGVIPSYLRAKCGGERSFRQSIEYSGTVTTSASGEITWKPGVPVALGCDCGPACGAPPLERERRFELLPFSRYLVGDGILLVRPAPSVD